MRRVTRVDKSTLTKLQIVRAATRLFLEKGYSATTFKMLAAALGMSPGNITFHFPTKEHLLAELNGLLCRFQWQRMDQRAAEGVSTTKSLAMEIAAVVAACEDDLAVRDLYLAAYRSPICMAIIRRNNVAQVKESFGKGLPLWTQEQFDAAEMLSSGVLYGALMTDSSVIPLATRVVATLDAVLAIYGLPAATRREEVAHAMMLDFHRLGQEIIADFRTFAEEDSAQTLWNLVNT